MGGRLHLFVCLLGGIVPHALGSRPRQEDALPRITEHPSDLIVLRGEPATLNCKAEGRPAPTVEWYKDGERVEIGKDDHRTLLHTGSLFFLRVQHTRRTKTDEGSYVCVARNYLGEAVSRNASLHIAMLRDDFRQQPADVVAAAGEAAMLECVPPRGHPEPTVSWKKDGVILRSGNDAVRINGGRLSISEVRRSDGGEYVCVATNSVGVRESKPAQLFVKERPTFVRKPLNQLVAANGSVEFNCEAQGDPRPDVSWTKLRGELPRDRHEVKADNTLRIWLARPSDAGTYTCVASSQLGRAEVSASLNVHVGPYASPQLVVQPRDQVVEEGQTATFHCLAAGNPPPSVFWQREGTQNLLFPNQPLQSSNRLWVSPSGDLAVSDVRPSDVGYYICHSLSVAGSVVAKAYLDVTDVTLENLPPIARQVAVNQTVPVARSVVLPCQAVGGSGGGATTPTVVYWLKGGTRIPSQDGRMSWQEGRGLQISYTRVEDTGIYTCVISNANGETSWNTFLEVKEGKRYTEMNAALAPRGPSRPEIVEVSRNTVTLSWKRDTLQPATSYIIEAFSRSLGKGWKIVAEGVRSETFTVRSLRQGAIFVFLVRAVNLHGASEPSAVSEPVRTEDPSPAEPGLDSALIQKELGRISIHLQDPVTLSSTALRLHWTVMQRPLYLQGFRVLYRPLSSSRSASGNWSVLEVRSPLEHGAVLSRLRKGFSYEAKVRAFFNGFQGPDSEARRGSTFEEAPSASPQHVEVKRCEEPGCDSITVTWQPPQEELQNGVILEYKLWCMGNSSELHINRTVEASSRSAVLRPIVPGVMYRITVAAVNSAGTGLRSPFTVLAPVASSSSSSQFDTFVKTPVFIVVVVVPVLLVAIVISIVVYCCCCRKRSSPDPYQGATKDPSFTFTPTVTFNPKDDTSMMSNASYPPFGGPGQTWTEPWQNAALNQNSPSQAIPDYCRPADHLSPFRNQLEQKETNLHRPRTPETPVYREVEPAHQLSGTQNFPGPRIKECQVLGKTSAYAASPPAQAALCNNMSSTARVTDKRTHKQPFLPRADGLPGTKNHMIEVTKLNNELAMTDGRGEAVAHHSTPEQSTMGSHASSERSSSSAHSGKRKNARTPKTGRQAVPGVAEPLPPPPALPPAELGSAGRAAQAEHERVDEGSGYPPERVYEYLQQNEEEHDEDDEEADEEDDLVVDEGKARGPQQYAHASYSLQSTAPCSPASPEERRPMIQAHSHEPPGRRKRAALERAARHYPGRPLLSARSPSPPCLYGYITGPMPSDLETEPAEEEEEEEEAAVAVVSAGTVSVYPKAGTVGAARFDAKKLLLSLEHTSVSSLGDPESSLAGSMLNGWGSASEGDGDDEDGGGSSDGGGVGGVGGVGGAGGTGTGGASSDGGSSESSFRVDADFADAIAAAAESAGLKLHHQHAVAQAAQAAAMGVVQPGAGVQQQQQQVASYTEDFALYSRPHFPATGSRALPGAGAASLGPERRSGDPTGTVSAGIKC
ncbi:roundabout homolog 1-like [Lampetra planeri]